MAHAVRKRRLLCLRATLLLLALPALAHAQTPASRELPTASDPTSDAADTSSALREASERYERAVRVYDEGNLDAALLEFKRAYELAPSFRILYNLAVVSLERRDYASALDYFERYLAQGQQGVPAELRAEVTSKLPDLASRVAALQIRTNVPGAEISVDDRPAGVAPLARPLRVNTGTHRVTARAPGWLPHGIVIEVAGSDQADVELLLVHAPSELPSELTPASRVPWLGWSATALLTAGAVFSGVQALSARDAVERKGEQLGISSSELAAAHRRLTRWSVAADVLALSALGLGGYCLYVTLQPAPALDSSAARFETLLSAGVSLSGAF